MRSSFIVLLSVLLILSWGEVFGLSFSDEKRLDFTGNNLRGNKIYFSNPELVEVLILDDCNLAHIPNEIEALINLKHLSLENNPQLNFEESITILQKLPKLKFLNLGRNKLVGVPFQISGLKNLNCLRLSYNSIKMDSAALLLSKLPKLRWLWIDNNNLDSLSPSLFSFPSLRFLYAYGNNISKLSIPQNQTGKLWVLHLGNNSFKELPIELIKIKRFRMAMFNKNQIEAIPEDFKTEKYSMSALILDHNLLNSEELRKGKKYFRGFMMYSARQ